MNQNLKKKNGRVCGWWKVNLFDKVTKSKTKKVEGSEAGVK